MMPARQMPDFNKGYVGIQLYEFSRSADGAFYEVRIIKRKQLGGLVRHNSRLLPLHSAKSLLDFKKAIRASGAPIWKMHHDGQGSGRFDLGSQKRLPFILTWEPSAGWYR